MSLKSEIQLKRMKLGIRAVDPNQNHTILYDIMQAALDIGTKWTEEVNELISDALGPGQWLRNLDDRLVNKITSLWAKRDQGKQWDRINIKRRKTTVLYRELNPRGTVAPIVAPYITTNPKRNEDIQQIFALRASTSNLRADLAIRKRTNISTCRLCGTADETARHVIDDCRGTQSI